mmetsp:Transcript_34770/g.67262  ORF Transcript_34770/g.67262 Transcript_34770/m.67262 type:complete len:384 (-) Transcript_34770:115-1266(-)
MRSADRARHGVMVVFVANMKLRNLVDPLSSDRLRDGANDVLHSLVLRHNELEAEGAFELRRIEVETRNRSSRSILSDNASASLRGSLGSHGHDVAVEGLEVENVELLSLLRVLQDVGVRANQILEGQEGPFSLAMGHSEHTGGVCAAREGHVDHIDTLSGRVPSNSTEASRNHLRRVLGGLVELAHLDLTMIHRPRVLVEQVLLDGELLRGRDVTGTFGHSRSRGEDKQLLLGHAPGQVHGCLNVLLPNALGIGLAGFAAGETTEEDHSVVALKHGRLNVLGSLVDNDLLALGDLLLAVEAGDREIFLQLVVQPAADKASGTNNSHLTDASGFERARGRGDGEGMIREGGNHRVVPLRPFNHIRRLGAGPGIFGLATEPQRCL